MYILKPFKRVSVDFYCDWIRGIIEYSSDAICNAFVCQLSVCNFKCGYSHDFCAICMPTRIMYYAYIFLGIQEGFC